MAEETTTIPLEDGSSGSSVDVGLDTTDARDGQRGTATEDVATLQQEIATLKSRNEQYLRERNGWEAQSRRNLDEQRATRERLANFEGQLQATIAGRSTPQHDLTYTPGQLKTALQKWLNGDETDLDGVEQTLAKLTPTAQRHGEHVKPDDLKKIVREELVELGTKANLQTVVGTRHPDMANPQSPLSQAVWQQYDAYAADTTNQMMFERNAKFDVPMRGPDGEQRMVDARLVDRLCTDLRLQGGIQEGRRQESRASALGSVQGGNGRTTQSVTNRVEALELLTTGERQTLADPRVRKGWKDIPEDPKAAAKFYWETCLTAQQRAERLTAYRRHSVTNV